MKDGCPCNSQYARSSRYPLEAWAKTTENQAYRSRSEGCWCNGDISPIHLFTGVETEVTGLPAFSWYDSFMLSFARLCVLSFLTTCVIALALGQEVSHPKVDPIYVALLQDDRQELAAKGSNDFAPANTRSVVTAFVAVGGQWKKLDVLKERMKWTVAFDGKDLGEIESEPRPFPEVSTDSSPVGSRTYLRAVHAVLTRPEKVPSVGEPQGRFNGAFETIVRRPLVLVSKPNYRDPDNWKPSNVLRDFIKPVQSELARVYSHIRECGSDGEPLTRDWKLPEAALEITKGYESAKHSYLVATHVRDHKCLFAVDGTTLTDLAGMQWFYIDGAKSVRYLGKDWELVDAGDYDATGNSQVIFFSGDAMTGREEYVLFYDDFRSRVTWAYP
jgi:hypothetical protein